MDTKLQVDKYGHCKKHLDFMTLFDVFFDLVRCT
jgi:hypothetical protein